MQTIVTERGQISIPAEIRRKYRLLPDTRVEWMEMEDGLFLLPVPADPVRAFRGSSRGLTRVLLKERRAERAREK